MASACIHAFVEWFEGNPWQNGDCWANGTPADCYGTCYKLQIWSPVCEDAPEGEPCPDQIWNYGNYSQCEAYSDDPIDPDCHCYADDPS